MNVIRYHPLITDGASPDMVPLFVTTDRNGVANNDFYLEEIVPRRYRLCSKENVTDAEATSFEIHCPVCGSVMRAVTAPSDTHRHSLYACGKCNRKH